VTTYRADEKPCQNCGGEGEYMLGRVRKGRTVKTQCHVCKGTGVVQTMQAVARPKKTV
jgi:DnaJ-class molecular chaperone